MNKALIFIGTSGSGKSALIERLTQDFGLKKVDVINYVLKLVALYGPTVSKKLVLKLAYKRFISGLKFKNFDIIEIASDFPVVTLPQIVKTVRQKTKKEIVLVFCQADLKTCLERNSKRQGSRLVPRSVIIKQSKYTPAFLSMLAYFLNIDFFVINTEKSIDDSYQELLKKLNSITGGRN